MEDQMASPPTLFRDELSLMHSCPSEPSLQRLESRLQQQCLMQATLDRSVLPEMGEDLVNVGRMREKDCLRQMGVELPCQM